MKIALIVDTAIVCELDDDEVTELFSEYIKTNYPNVECDMDEILVVPTD